MDSSQNPSNRRLLRSKRTRNTSTGDESVKLPATKKRRSALRRDTFEPLTDSSLNEIAGRSHPHDHHEAKSNGVAVEPTERQARSGAHLRELTLRGGKKNEKRSERGTGLLTLSTTPQYTLSQLPALPEQIRARPTVSYSCVISPENDYILALTHTDALVWSYNASASTPTARELLSFKLPFPPAITEDPRPLAAFTPKAANGEPGIVVVAPKWGKVVYWETLSSATSYTPTQSANGVQGTIPGMFHGEVVKDLVPAEPAGFVLALASGRVAHLTVRDQMGRPAIGIQFMRKSSAGSARGGIFGSIRNALVGDRRKGAPIVRPAKVARAQREVLVCTQDAQVEFWTNNLLTGNHLEKTVDLQAPLMASLESQIDQDQMQQPLQLKLLDFVLATPPSTHDVIRPGEADATALTVLVALSSRSQTTYYLIEVTVAEGSTQIRVIHPIRCYSDDAAGDDQTGQPRICIPPSSLTAFVLFDKAIVVMSLSKITESPSSQLLGEKHQLPQPFQDCIRLQDNSLYHIINFAPEEHESAPSCVFAIQGFGIARLVSHLPTDAELDVDCVVSKVDAKSRIEQAIFFGTKPSNPFDLTRTYRHAYSTQDIRKAILTLSRDIVRSTSKHISKSSSSAADHLQQRARALQDLIEYASRVYPDCVTRADRVLMLWNAEKVASAQAIWSVQEKIQATYPRKDEREMTYMNFALMTLSEKRQDYPKPEKGESDHVRHWLIRSTTGIAHFLVELDDAINELAEIHLTDPQIVCDYFLEGTELWIAGQDAAFKFREDNAAVYGLGNESYQNGVLLSGYPADLPPAWTSTDEQTKHARSYILNVCAFLGEWWDFSANQANGAAAGKSQKAKQMPVNDETGEPYDAPTRDSLMMLAQLLPQQVDLANRIAREANIQQRVHVEAADRDPDDKQHQLEALKQELEDVVRSNIRAIAPYNRDGAIALAEDEKDTHLLVILNLEYLAELGRALKSRPGDEQAIMGQIRAVQDHVETYFERFGNDWAYAHFSSMINRGELGRLIGEGQADNGRKQPYITWFFDTCRKHDKRVGRIAWINNIIGENKYDAACRTLEGVADTEEADLWSKKTEICLAKLAGLAALEQASSALNETTIDRFDCELEYLHIVESLARHINAALYNAMDDDAAVQLAVDLYIPKSMSTNRKAQQQRKHLVETLYKLVTNQIVPLEDLVGALTLFQFNPLDPDLDVDDISGSEFPLALLAIDLAPLKEVSLQQKETLRRTVWRRLLIKDDWTMLNQTAGKSDEQVKEEMQRTVLFMTLLDVIKRAEEDKIDIRIPSVDEITEVTDDKAPDEVKDELAKLKKFVDKARLKDHFSALVKEAKDELRRFRDMEGDAQADDVLVSGPVNGDVVTEQVNGRRS